MSAAVSAPLAEVLRAGRGEFNSLFALARQRFRDLSGDDVFAFVRECIDPLAQAVSKLDPQRVADVVHAAYEIGVDLVGHKLAGQSLAERCVELAWREVAVANVRHVAAEPVRLLAALCNAVHQIRSTPGADHRRFVDTMRDLGPQCGDVATWLRLGQLAGWRAGLAHYRLSALDVAAQMPGTLVRGVLELPVKPAVGDALAGLRRDPWFDPAQRGLRLVRRYGAFRGFGGLFLAPPQVAAAGDDLLVRSGADCWLLFADRFGTTLHRAPREAWPHQPAPLPQALRVQGGGVSEGAATVDLGAAGAVTSVACTSTTVVCTSERSHALALLAR